MYTLSTPQNLPSTPKVPPSTPKIPNPPIHSSNPQIPRTADGQKSDDNQPTDQPNN
jgi:hypothetical protein